MAAEKTVAKAKKKEAASTDKIVNFEPPETDLTEEKGKKKRNKKVKTPKEPKNSEEKKLSGIMALGFMTVFLLCLCVFLYISVAQDIGGMRTKLIHAVSSLDPNYRTLSQKIEAYNIDQRTLEQEQAELIKQQAELIKQQEELAKKSAEIAAREANTLPVAMRGYTDEQIADFVKLAETFTKMESSEAADIISRLYDVSHMAIILYYMDINPRAEILSAMNRDLAAKVTSEILRT